MERLTQVCGKAVRSDLHKIHLTCCAKWLGLAWMQTTGQDEPSLSGLTVFRDWPGKCSRKVPSAFSYSATSGGCKQWGHSIDDDSKVLRWTKMDPEPRTKLQEFGIVKELMKGLALISRIYEDEDAAIRNEIPRHLTKGSEDIVRDYLTKLVRHWYNYMRAQGHHTLENVPLDIIITHPAVRPPCRIVFCGRLISKLDLVLSGFQQNLPCCPRGFPPGIISHTARHFLDIRT